MWSSVLTVALLCWGSDGRVTCRNKNNGEVDWYILYKAPAGLKYMYTDSDKKTEFSGNIKDPNDALANTLKPLFQPIRSMPADFGFISYSDQPPGCNADSGFGHSKGVLMMDSKGPGVWLLHSTPQFPFSRDPAHFWPESGVRNAQTFICVTFNYNEFKQIGKHLQYIRAFPFEHDVPDNFHNELKDAANRVQADLPTNYMPPQLTSAGGQKFHSFAKKGFTPSVTPSKRPRESVNADKDIYLMIAREVKSSLNVQTWRQQGRVCSYCEETHHVINIKSIKKWNNVLDWTPGSDHSKWCVAVDNNKPWICIADLNRAKSQFERGGGALCLNNAPVVSLFKGFIGELESCKEPNTNTLDCN